MKVAAGSSGRLGSTGRLAKTLLRIQRGQQGLTSTGGEEKKLRQRSSSPARRSGGSLMADAWLGLGLGVEEWMRSRPRLLL